MARHHDMEELRCVIAALQVVVPELEGLRLTVEQEEMVRLVIDGMLRERSRAY